MGMKIEIRQVSTVRSLEVEVDRTAMAIYQFERSVGLLKGDDLISKKISEPGVIVKEPEEKTTVIRVRASDTVQEGTIRGALQTYFDGVALKHRKAAGDEEDKWADLPMSAVKRNRRRADAKKRILADYGNAIRELRDASCTYKEIADTLNLCEIETIESESWSESSVANFLLSNGLTSRTGRGWHRRSAAGDVVAADAIRKFEKRFLKKPDLLVMDGSALAGASQVTTLEDLA